MAKVLVFGSLLLILVAIILSATSIATPYWSTIKSIKEYAGLWKSCSTVFIKEICVTMIRSTNETWFKTVQSFAVISLISCVMAGILAVLWTWGTSFDRSKSLLIATIVCTVFACAASLITIAIYGDKIRDTDGLPIHLGWSYYLALAECIILVPASILLIILAARGSDSDQFAYRAT